jgi:hypothetical protein
MTNKHIAICIPSTGSWHSRTATSLMGLSLNRNGLTVSVHALDVATIAMSRNLLVREALECGASHVLFVDSDMAIPSDALHRLLAWEKDIVGVCYPMRRAPYDLVGRPLTVTGDGQYPDLTEMEFLGGGCLLISTHVFKAIRQPWFFETYNYPDRTPREQFYDSLRDQFPGLPGAALDRIRSISEVTDWLVREEAHGRNVTWTATEDVTFCGKARAHGFQIWADMTLMMDVQHIGKKYNQVGRQDGDVWPVTR